jgi:hypothetical protein
MAKIIDPDLLTQGTEVTINTTTKIISLSATGNMTTEGVSMQSLYSFLKEEWKNDVTLIPFPFPMVCIDAEAGKYELGTDGISFNGWAIDTATSATSGYKLVRDAGWMSYNTTGGSAKAYSGIVTLGSVGVGDQLYYEQEQYAPATALTNFTYTGPVNEPIEIDPALVDTTYLEVFARIGGKVFSSAKLSDAGEVATGPKKISLPVSNSDDAKITHTDAAIAADSPYTSITVTYYTANQARTIGGVAYDFDVIIDGANATAEQIYEKIQYQLRQTSDIDAGAGSVVGKSADALLRFVGDTLYTTDGVYIDNFNSNDTNRLVFTDVTGTERTYPFVAAGTIVFNNNLQTDASAKYWMFFKTLPGAGNDFGESGAVLVKDSSNNDITGTVGGSASISFSFAYDTNTQGGRTSNTDALITLVAIGLDKAQYVSTEHLITKTVGQNISLVSSLERNYRNP